MTLEELEVYKGAIVFEDNIWTIVLSWDSFAKDTLGKQLARSSDSLSANIAEGYGRFFYKENKQFCYYSRGSLLETKNRVVKTKNRNLINEEQYSYLISEIDIIHRMLNGYIKSIGGGSNNQ